MLLPFFNRISALKAFLLCTHHVIVSQVRKQCKLIVISKRRTHARVQELKASIFWAEAKCSYLFFNKISALKAFLLCTHHVIVSQVRKQCKLIVISKRRTHARVQELKASIFWAEAKCSYLFFNKISALKAFLLCTHHVIVSQVRKQRTSTFTWKCTPSKRGLCAWSAASAKVFSGH